MPAGSRLKTPWKIDPRPASTLSQAIAGKSPKRRERMRRLFIGLMVVLTTSLAMAGNQEVANQIAQNLRDSGKMNDYRIAVKFQDGTAWLQGHVTDQAADERRDQDRLQNRRRESRRQQLDDRRKRRRGTGRRPTSAQHLRSRSGATGFGRRTPGIAASSRRPKPLIGQPASSPCPWR